MLASFSGPSFLLLIRTVFTSTKIVNWIGKLLTQCSAAGTCQMKELLIYCGHPMLIANTIQISKTAKHLYPVLLFFNNNVQCAGLYT
jgi:hypothetical protein